jgi:integrase
MNNIAKRPDGRWRARYRDVEGKEHSKHFSRKIDAQRWLDAVITTVVTGTYTDPKAGRVTIDVWADVWLAGQTHLKPTTLERYRNIVDVHIRPKWKTLTLSDVTHAAVQAWVTSLASRRSAASVRKTHRVLSLMLALAVRDGRLARNPADPVNLPSRGQGRASLPNPRPGRALASETGKPPATNRVAPAERAAAASYELVVLTLSYCGLRWGELAALKVGRVDVGRAPYLSGWTETPGSPGESSV